MNTIRAYVRDCSAQQTWYTWGLSLQYFMKERLHFGQIRPFSRQTVKKLFKYSFKGNPFRKEPGTVFIQEDETWKAALQTRSRAKREKRAPQNLGFKDFFSKGLLIVPSFLKHWVHLTFKISDFTLSKSVSLFSKIALFGIPKVIQGHCCI